jgi:hypothetical protein
MDRREDRAAVQGKPSRVVQRLAIKSTIHGARHTINRASYSRMITRLCLSGVPRMNGGHISRGTRRFVVNSTTGIEIHFWRSFYSFHVLRTRMCQASMHLLASSRRVTFPRNLRWMHYVLFETVSRLSRSSLDHV